VFIKEILLIDFYCELIEKKLNVLIRYKKNLIGLYGFPIRETLLENEDIELEELLDAITYKFNKIQSLIGEKMFKLILEYAGYSVNEKSFLEVLAILEKEDIVDMRKWRELRTFRNSFSHTYPHEIVEMTEGINKLIHNIDYLNKVFVNLKRFKEKADEAYSKRN